MFAPGTRIGPLTILRLLGRGGMGEVYEAEQTTLRRRVAAKRIADHLVENPEALRRFEREAQTLARVHGEHIVAVHEFGRYPGPDGRAHVLLVLELVEGGLSLRRALESGPLAWAESASAIRQAAEGLALAQESGIVHRDIKPDNLLITRRGVVKLTDFGLAKALDSTALSLGGTLLGTPAYMAPEVCAGEPADARSDLYSLGATWYQLIAGRPPYASDSTLAMLRLQQQAPVPDPVVAVPGLPGPIGALIRRLLAKRPEERFPAPAVLAEAIDALAGAGLAVPRLIPAVAERGLARAAPDAAAQAPTVATTPGPAPSTVATAAAAQPTLLATPATLPAPACPTPATAGMAPPPRPPARRPWRLPAAIAVGLAVAVAAAGALLLRPAPAAGAPAPLPAPADAAPPVSTAVPAATVEELAAQVDAALAARRLGDAQRLADILASRGWRPEQVAAVQRAVRSAERGWEDSADQADEAVAAGRWIEAADRLQALPADRIAGTRAISARREDLAGRIRQGAALAWGEARQRVQEELDRGRPLIARQRLLEARPLAALLGRLPEYDRQLRALPPAR